MDEKAFKELTDSVREMGAIRRGEKEPSRVSLSAPDIKAIRKKLGNLTQRQFAQFLGVPIQTLRNWEQGRRSPTGAARALLLVAYLHPEAVRAVRKVLAA